MTNENSEFHELDGLLEQERAFLLEGDLEGLGTLMPAKERLVELLLSDVQTNREQIRPLEGKLQRNQLLLDGALDGIRSVAARLAALRQVRSALETYDARGQKKRVEMEPNPRFEKRA